MGSPNSWPPGLCGQSPCTSLGFSAAPGPSCCLQSQGRATTEPASLEECHHQKGLESSYPSLQFNNRGQEAQRGGVSIPGSPSSQADWGPEALWKSRLWFSRLTWPPPSGCRAGRVPRAVPCEGHRPPGGSFQPQAAAACAALGGRLTPGRAHWASGNTVGRGERRGRGKELERGR